MFGFHNISRETYYMRNTKSNLLYWSLLLLTVLIQSVRPLPVLATTANIAPSNKSVETSMELTLAEAINVALRYNRTVKSAYLDRVVQKFDLKVAEDKFKPDVTLSSSPSVSGSETRVEGATDTIKTRDKIIDLDVETVKLFKTGGQLAFSWNRSRQWTDTTTNTTVEEWTRTNTWQVDFTHPLLKGFGIGVNTASVTLAQIEEQSYLLSLRDTIISTVNDTIQAFRNYAQTFRQLDIIKSSLERSRANMEINELLISMGRIPANEIIQNESDLANQEFSYETALNDLDSARLQLLKVLDLGRDTKIRPMEETDLSPVHPDLKNCIKMAFKNRSDYLNAVMNSEKAGISLTLARNNKKWDLNFVSKYSNTDTNNQLGTETDYDSWEAGLNLRIPLYGDLTRKQTLISAQIAQEKAKIFIQEIEQNITLEVSDAVREVETRLKQVGMAERSRVLSEKKLSIEKEKLKVGRTTNFQVVSFQNELVDSLNDELDAKVAYLNSLTFLDTIIGTTLDTWKIDYNKENDKWPGK